jgi:phospholipid/cholesterol/gamma-HCH transport system substrate-binding protein
MLALCSLAAMVYKFGDLPEIFSNSFQVYVRFPTAPGVQKDTPVRFCGYQIGKVTSVMAPTELENLFTSEKYHQTKVVLSIRRRYGTIPSNVEVKLVSRGLGSSSIELKVDPNKLPAPPYDPCRPLSVHLVPGLELQGSSGIASEFVPEETIDRLNQVAGDVHSFMTKINEVLDDAENQKTFKKIVDNVCQASDDAVKAVRQATEAMEQLSEFASVGTAVVQDANSKLDELVVAIADTSSQLGKTATELRLVLEKVNQGEGSAGRLVNDGRLYESLLDSTEQIQLLLLDLRLFITRARDKGVPLKLK